MYLIFLLLLIILLLLLTEKIQLSRSIAKLNVRVLVNGTRGKSTVVKYMSDLLRQNNFKTMSKVTGVKPTVTLPDGTSQILKRRGGARVNEQFEMIRKAASINSDSLVLECMSINPEYQKIESRVFKPHFYIITNIREDHLEEMGTSPDDWVGSICSAIPENSVVLTSERKYRKEIECFARERNSRLMHVDDLGTVLDSSDDADKDNALLTLLLADEMKIDPEGFLINFRNDRKDNLNYYLSINGFEVNFINGFAINDVPSAEILLNNLKRNGEIKNGPIFIFNSRGDRPIRSKNFARWFGGITEVANFIITGEQSPFTKREMIKNGIDKNRIVIWNRSECGAAVNSLREIVNKNCTIIGIGNIKGAGFEIINSIAGKAK